MNRYLVLCMVAMGAAPAAAAELPVPPVPPAELQVSQNAPTPDLDVQAPVVTEAEQPSLNVRLYRSKTYDPAYGFAPGSRYQSSEDRKPIQTPGLSVSVPIQ